MAVDGIGAAMSPENSLRRRRIIQWIIAPVVVIVIGLGWRYPALGFAVPVVMAMGIVGSMFRGRYVCGHLCPRGAFFDRWLGWAGPKRPIPGWMRGMGLRWTLLVVLMGFMVFNLSRDPSNWRHWGHVFWLMCAVTTGVGLVLVALVHPRGWCTICPMGTVQNFIGGRRDQLIIETDKCRLCHKCEKVCPLHLPVTRYKEDGVMRDRDCLKCSECVAACPFKALHWRGKAGEPGS